MIVLDYNEKLLIIEVLEVLLVLGLLLVQIVLIHKASNLYNEQVKKVNARRFVTFCFLLGSSIQCPLFVGFEATSHKAICRKIGQMHLSIVEEYFSVELRHNFHIALISNTPLKRFTVDFIHFKYCF